MEATYCMGTDVDVCRMFDQYLYKVSSISCVIIAGDNYFFFCVMAGTWVPMSTFQTLII
jgi:hypothetical protein